jgi:hypothetical protein
MRSISVARLWFFNQNPVARSHYGQGSGDRPQLPADFHVAPALTPLVEWWRFRIAKSKHGNIVTTFLPQS